MEVQRSGDGVWGVVQRVFCSSEGDGDLQTSVSNQQIAVTKGFPEPFQLDCHSSSPGSLSVNSASSEELCQQTRGWKSLTTSPLMHLHKMETEDLDHCCGSKGPLGGQKTLLDLLCGVLVIHASVRPQGEGQCLQNCFLWKEEALPTFPFPFPWLRMVCACHF